MNELKQGWFADYNDEEDEFPGYWQPFYQWGGSVFSVSIAWNTKEECEEFIEHTLIGQAFKYGEK